MNKDDPYKTMTNILFLPGPLLSVRMLNLVVPKQVMLGDKSRLECIFDLEGEILYSVKWYKGGHEFFRS